MNREFFIPKKIIFGDSASADTAEYISEYGKKALVVSGKHISKLNAFANLICGLEKNGVNTVMFSEITSEPTDTMIEKGVEVYKNNDCDLIIAVGGGSPIDAMKAIAAVNTCGGKISDYAGKEITGDFPPMIAVPTTAGTGSEATRFTVITDTVSQAKLLLNGRSLMPDAAIEDAALSISAPRFVTASTGLDALTHAVESYTSRKAQPLTDDISLSAVKRIFSALPEAYKNGDNVNARKEMTIAALEAGIAINNASVTIVHGMSRPIGALFHVPHGLSNAMLLAECMDFAKDKAINKFAELGRAIGAAAEKDSDETAAEKFIGALREICRKCEVPSPKEYGIDKDAYYKAIDKMSADAVASGSPANTIRSVTKEDITTLYKKIYG